MRIKKENTITLVVDVQERLYPVMHNRDNLVKNCVALLRGMNELKIPVWVTQQYTRGLGETLPEIKSVIDGFDPVEKREFSCCDEPLFRSRLEKEGVVNVIICGIESHVCVLQTAVDLKEGGYNPVVVMDCVSSRLQENIDLARERFRYEGIMMTSYESVLFELTRSSAADEFRAISRLVK